MKTKVSIKRIKFGGLAAVELKTAAVRLVVITAKGPRIAFFGRPDGANLLMWQPGKYFRGPWELMGGHRVWVSRPGADEAEETYAEDNQPCEVEIGKGEVTFRAATDKALMTQRGFTVRLLAADRVELEHFVINHSAMLWSGGLWSISCTLPGADTRYLVPLGDGSTWDYTTVIAIRTWGHDQGAKTFSDDRFEMTDDAFRLNPVRGRENKRMLKADPGILAMYEPAQQLAFVVRAAYQPDGNYPLGTNMALYIGKDSFMVELETMGPFVTLKPHQQLKHTETWVLRDAKSEPTAKALKALF